MRHRKRVRLRLGVVVGLAGLVAPLVQVSATADDELTETLTAVVYRPDGETPAPAAVIDLALAGSAAFARSVSDYTGAVDIDVPEDDELVALARVADGTVTVNWTASELFWPGGEPPTRSESGVAFIAPTPSFSQATGTFIARLIESTSHPDMPRFHIMRSTMSERIVTKVADRARALGVFMDPDMVSGNDDLDDPDLIPPLGATIDTHVITDTVSGATTDLLTAADPPGAEDYVEGCPRMETWRLPNGDPKHTPMRGTAYSVTLGLDKCTNERDRNRDYWVWEWDGDIESIDTNEEVVHIWRFKFRTELDRSNDGYVHLMVDPDGNRRADDDGDPITWSVGMSHGPVNGSVSGNFPFIKAKKIHAFKDRAPWKLYHVSWISENGAIGSRGQIYYNGGAMFFAVPQGEKQARIRRAGNTLQTWRCWAPRQVSHSNPARWSCDPRD